MEVREDNNNCSCVFCPRIIDKKIRGNDFARLNPCNCICCPKCAIVLTSNRKTKNAHCNNCERDIDSIKYFEASRSNRKKGKSIPLEKFKFDFEKDPCRFFMKLFEGSSSSAKMVDSMILSLSFTHGEDIGTSGDTFYGPKLISCALHKKYGPETDNDRMNLRTIFALLHYPIMNPHTESIKNASYPRMTAAEFIEFCLHDDESYLLQLIYALAKGKIEFVPSKRTYKEDKSNFLAICVAKQMIERSNIHRPTPFQSMMSDVMIMNNASVEYQDLLSQLRISAGRRTTERNMKKRGVILKTTAIDIPVLGAMVLHIDNFGFLGKQGKWSIHTVIQVSIITEQELRNLGFYNNGMISRQRRSIDDLLSTIADKLADNIDDDDDDNEITDLANNDDVGIDDKAQTVLAKQIVEPKQRDIAELTKRVLTSIQTAIDSKLPDAVECRSLLSECCESKWRHPVKRNLGFIIDTNRATSNRTTTTAKNKVNGIKNGNASVIRDGDVIDIHNEIHGEEYLTETYYEKNNIHLDNTMHGDPNSYLVCEKMIKYLEDISGKDTLEYDERTCNGEEPVRFIISPATADGAPAKRYLDFINDDVQSNGEGNYDNRTYKTARIFMSGFHFLMEFLSMRGSLFSDIFSFFGRKWRESDPSFNWIHVIRDPKDALNEFPQYLLAQYRSAAESAASVLGIPLNDITPAQVDDYMVDRAVEVPMVMACLFDMRLLEIALMIRDAEKIGKHGDVQLFLSTLRLSLALFTITHAINYCHMVAEFLEWWELSSEAEKILFENFYYTNISPNNKPVWVDKGVEWTVRHIRSFMGHRVRPANHDSFVERLVSDIPFRIKAKRDLRYILGSEDRKDYTTEDWNDQTMLLDTPFVTTRIALDDTNFWGPGCLKGELHCESNDDENCIFYEASRDEKLQESPVSSSILNGFEIGINRSINYFKQHHIINQHQKKRSEAEVSLKQLPTNAAMRKDDLNRMKIIRLSTNPKDIEPLSRYYQKNRIIETLSCMRDELYPDIPDNDTLKAFKRRDLVVILCEQRKKYFDEFPEVLQRKTEELNEVDEADSRTTKATRKEHIKGRLYQLDKEIKRDYVPNRI